MVRVTAPLPAHDVHHMTCRTALTGLRRTTTCEVATYCVVLFALYFLGHICLVLLEQHHLTFFHLLAVQLQYGYQTVWRVAR